MCVLEDQYIALKDSKRVVAILDAKWKRIKSHSTKHEHGIVQSDMYQLYAYGKLNMCKAVFLVYPRTGHFEKELRFDFFDGLPLICLPFDVTKPEHSVQQSLELLDKHTSTRVTA